MCLANITDELSSEESKTINGHLRLQARMAAEMNSVRVAEFPNLSPCLRALLEVNAALFKEIAK